MAATKPTGPAKAAGMEQALACDVGQCVRHRRREGAQKDEAGIPALGAQGQAWGAGGGGAGRKGSAEALPASQA